MKQSSRRAAFDVLTAVEERNAYANLQLAHVLQAGDLQKADRGLVTELVLGVLRRQNTLDFALDRLLERPGKIPANIRRLLRLGTYQVFFLDRIPDAVASHETVELTKEIREGKLVSLVNGVLRQLVREKHSIPWPKWEDDPLRYLVVMESHPEWMVKRWIKQHGAATARMICEANNRPVGVALRVNTLRIHREQYLELLSEAEVVAQPSELSNVGIRLTASSAVTALPGFREGFFSAQDESSMIIAPVVDPQPGDTIVDACAAPGGKTTHLAEFSGDKAFIYAWDVHPHKLGLIRQNCERLGIESVKIEKVDAQGPLPNQLFDHVDRVLVDAPCSGLGVLRRKPELRYRMTEQGIERLKKLQENILDSVVQLIRPGGVLVYSTCTIEPEENFQQVKNFLSRHPNFEAEDMEAYLPAIQFSDEEKRQIGKGYWQIMPYRCNSDGFFVARLKREG